MCTITGKSRRKSVKGYKIAIKTETGWYSLYSGMKYETGVVPDVKMNPSSEEPAENALFPTIKLLWDNRMKGFTAVLETKKGFDRIWKNDTFVTSILVMMLRHKQCKLVCLEMTIKGGILDGYFNDEKTYLGKEITGIKEIETLDVKNEKEHE